MLDSNVGEMALVFSSGELIIALDRMRPHANIQEGSSIDADLAVVHDCGEVTQRVGLAMLEVITAAENVTANIKLPGENP